MQRAAASKGAPLSYGIITAVLILTFSLSIVKAQTQPEQLRLKNTQMMIYSGKCAEAILILREFHSRYPTNVQISMDLKNAFVCNRDYDSAKVILDHLLASSVEPAQRISFQLELGGLYLSQGLTEEAGKQFQTAFASNGGNQTIYSQVHQVYMASGYYSDAVRVLQEGRKRFNDPILFTKELGNLYQVMRNYGDAAREYFALLVKDTASEVFVSGQFAQLIKMNVGEEFDTGLKKAMLEILKEHPKNPDAQRYYGDYLMALGNYSEAFARFVLVDSLENSNGKNLIYFAQVATDNQMYALVERAAQYLISRFPQSPVKTQAQFLLGGAFVRSKKYTEANALFENIYAASPNDRDKEEALLNIAFVRYNGLHDPQSALDVLVRLRQQFPRSQSNHVASLAMADCYLTLGKHQIADSLYKAIPQQQLPQDTQEELLFKQGELQFYLGNFADARDAYGKLMNTYPKSVFVNDCLQRIMLISDNAGMDEIPLRLFADACYATARFDYDTALVMYDKLKNMAGTALAEISWFNQGAVHQTLGQGAQALAQFDSLIALFPESFFTPLAVEHKGDVFAEINLDCKGAKAMYESVLLSYTKSLNVEAVRRKLQHLERTLCTQPEKPKS